MKISNASKNVLSVYIVGDEQPWLYRSGSDLVTYFNKLGYRDDIYDKGLPKLNNSSLNTSRKQYSKDRLLKIKEEESFKGIIEDLINQSHDKELASSLINKEINQDNCSAILLNGEYVLIGIESSSSYNVSNEVSFNDIQDKILNALDNAKVSIIVAMAWFTNNTLADKLLQKQNEGVDVELVIYNDGVNAKHGVDLSGLKHTKIRGTRGGLMHNKFCVIDNQIFITGSYNWSVNAEAKNDENITIARDPETATKYSVEFRRLKSITE